MLNPRESVRRKNDESVGRSERWLHHLTVSLFLRFYACSSSVAIQRTCVLLVALLISGAATAHAQDSYRELALQDPRPRFYHEAFAWPGGDSVGLAVTFRIPNTQLVFEQTPDGFVAKAEVVVCVLRDGDEVASHTWRATHRESSFEATQDRLRDVQGVVPFTLSPGRYTYTLEGGEQTRLRASSRQEVALAAFEGASVGEAVLMHYAERDEHSAVAEPVGLSGDLARPAP